MKQDVADYIEQFQMIYSYHDCLECEKIWGII